MEAEMEVESQRLVRWLQLRCCFAGRLLAVEVVVGVL